MKILAYIAIGLAAVAIGLGLYNQIEYVPKLTDDARELFGSDLWHHYHDTSMFYGYIEFAVGGLAFILGVIPAIKKEKIGWVAVVLGLVGFFLGASHCTHMFS